MGRNITEQGETEAVSDELFEFLKSWLINHIIDEDLKFKTFLAQR